MINHIARIILMVYGFAVATFFVYVLSDVAINPMTPLSVVVDNPTINPGETLIVTVEFSRRKVCVAHSVYFLTRTYLDNGLMKRDVYLRLEEPLSITIGHVKATHRISTPVNLPSGDYKLQISIWNECSIITRIDDYPEADVAVR